MALLLLFINDYYLKQAFPGMISGKLSDFAGLFLFSLFWFPFFPGRRFLVALAVIGFFVFWEIAVFRFLINTWNNMNIVCIIRVVDYSDLTAASIVPVAYLYSKKPKKRNPSDGSPSLWWLTSVLDPKLNEFVENTFTSYRYTETPLQFSFNSTKARVVTALDKHFSVESVYDPRFSTLKLTEFYDIIAKPRCCFEAYRSGISPTCDRFDQARVGFLEENSVTTLKLYALHVCDEPDRSGKQSALKIFEQTVIEAIRRGVTPN